MLVTNYTFQLPADPGDGPADEDPGPPAAADQRAHGENRPGNRPSHPAVAARDPGRPRRARRAFRPGDGDPAARPAHVAADRAFPDRGGGARQGRAGPRLHDPPQHRGLPQALVRQGGGDRRRDLEPVRRRRGARVPGPLRPLGAERRAPAPAGGARHHARPVPPQHVPRDAGDVRLRPALPRARQAWPAGRGRPAAQADRARLPLPRAHPLRGTRGPASLHGGMGPGDGGARPRRTRSTPSTRSSTATSR